MILSCPSCSTRFRVADKEFRGEGRKVRCGRCGHTWEEHLAAAPAEPAAPAAPEPEPVIDEPEPEPDFVPSAEPELVAEAIPDSLLDFDLDDDDDDFLIDEPMITPPAYHRAGWLAWSIYGALVVILLGGLRFGRDLIVAAWPPAQRLYVTLGIPVDDAADGLVIRELSPTRVMADGEEALVLTGEIVNLSGQVKPVPPLRVELRDAAGADLAQWTFAPYDVNMIPNEIVSFETRYAKPPPAATDIALIFVRQPKAAETAAAEQP